MSSRVLKLREAGHVQRCHTVPHHGSYSVAEHSWQAATLLIALHPDPSPDLLKAVLLHDVAERWTGDVPNYAKVADRHLATALGNREQEIQRVLGVDLYLTTEDEWWLKAVDVLELWLWTEDQDALGNQHVSRVRENIVEFMNSHGAVLPREVLTFWGFQEWERQSDLL